MVAFRTSRSYNCVAATCSRGTKVQPFGVWISGSTACSDSCPWTWGVVDALSPARHPLRAISAVDHSEDTHNRRWQGPGDDIFACIPTTVSRI